MSGNDRTTLRPLEPWEQTFHFYDERYPCHFCLAAELRPAVTAALLTTSLAALQDVHPLLRAAVSVTEDGTMVFRNDPAEIPLRCHPAETRWEDVVARVQAEVIDVGQAPLARADLISGAGLLRRGPAPASDPRMDERARPRRPDGSRPEVMSIEFDEARTDAPRRPAGSMR